MSLLCSFFSVDYHFDKATLSYSAGPGSRLGFLFFSNKSFHECTLIAPALFSLQIMGYAKTVTHPVNSVPDRRKTSAQNVGKVCQSPLRAASAGLYFNCCNRLHPALFAAGRFLTMQQTCVSKCSAGFFASQLSGVCEACPQGCSLCVDARRCSRCQSSRRAPLFLQNGQCVTECVRSGICPVSV